MDIQTLNSRCLHITVMFCSAAMDWHVLRGEFSCLVLFGSTVTLTSIKQLLEVSDIL